MRNNIGETAVPVAAGFALITFVFHFLTVSKGNDLTARLLTSIVLAILGFVTIVLLDNLFDEYIR